MDNFTGATVLDIGCGFGDFFHFLQEENVEVDCYKGLDVNPELINVASNKFPGVRFEVGDPLLMNRDITADIVVMSGVFNLNFEEIGNWAYVNQMIETVFEWANRSLIFDVLSANRTDNYPEEDFVYYYEPSKVIDVCFNFTPYVSLKHDYESIPQREMTLKLSHSPQ